MYLAIFSFFCWESFDSFVIENLTNQNRHLTQPVILFDASIFIFIFYVAIIIARKCVSTL